jgi:integrase
MRSTAFQVRGIPRRRRSGRTVTAGRRGSGHGSVGAADVRALADELGSALIRAVRGGVADEPAHAGGRQPPAGKRAASINWYAFALEYLEMRWPVIAAKTRDETNDALCAITQTMLQDVPGRPNDQLLRRALRDWAFVVPRPEPRRTPVDVRLALRWVAGASRPLTELLDPAVMRAVLEALRLRQDGTAAAAETQRHKRKTLVNAVRYAIEQDKLPTDPLAAINWRAAETVQQVDPRVVANPAQARSLLCAVSYVGGYGRARGRRLVGLFAGMYYAGLRPAEAVAVALPDCLLPAEGWGRATLHRTLPQAGRKWTDTGRLHDERGLKNRPPGDTRVVPLPPRLVVSWRESIDTFGTADDGRLFFNEHGGIVASGTYDRVWHEARELALPPDLVGSPLAARPYDLRHSALSTWLNAGVDPTEVATRAGNSVEVLLTRYAKCLYGREAVANQRIESLLREYELGRVFACSVVRPEGGVGPEVVHLHGGVAAGRAGENALDTDGDARVVAADCRVVLAVGQVHPHGPAASLDQSLDAHSAGFVLWVAAEVRDDPVDHVLACVDAGLELRGDAVHDVDRSAVEFHSLRGSGWWCGHAGPVEGHVQGVDGVRVHHLAERLAQLVGDAFADRVGDFAGGGVPFRARHVLQYAESTGHRGGDASVEESLLDPDVDVLLTGGVHILRCACLADDGDDVRPSTGLPQPDLPCLLPRAGGEVAEVTLASDGGGCGCHAQALGGNEQFVAGFQGDRAVTQGRVGGSEVGDVIEDRGDGVVDGAGVPGLDARQVCHEDVGSLGEVGGAGLHGNQDHFVCRSGQAPQFRDVATRDRSPSGDLEVAADLLGAEVGLGVHHLSPPPDRLY